MNETKVKPRFCYALKFYTQTMLSTDYTNFIIHQIYYKQFLLTKNKSRKRETIARTIAKVSQYVTEIINDLFF